MRRLRAVIAVEVKEVKEARRTERSESVVVEGTGKISRGCGCPGYGGGCRVGSEAEGLPGTAVSGRQNSSPSSPSEITTVQVNLDCCGLCISKQVTRQEERVQQTRP